MSKEHLLVDYHSGKQMFCSPLLVNAILAIGARFTSLPEAFKDQNDPSSAGQHFFEEAQRLSGLEEIPSLTKIQALSLMSLSQASCARPGRSYFSRMCAVARKAVSEVVAMRL